MTVEEMMGRIARLKRLASNLEEMSRKNTDEITIGDLESVEEAADIILDYVEELGRKKVV